MIQTSDVPGFAGLFHARGIGTGPGTQYLPHSCAPAVMKQHLSHAAWCSQTLSAWLLCLSTLCTYCSLSLSVCVYVQPF